MCGILACYAWDAPPLEPRRFARMNACHRLRGPDALQETHLLDGRLSLGHARLAILDLDPRANQPMASPDGRRWIVFNGEIYNFKELRAKLEAEGETFRTTSDTEALLHGLARWGEDALTRVEGMFAFVYADLDQGFLLAGRDRLGVKPLSMLRLPGRVAFASTVTPLAMLPGFDGEIDPQARFEMLALKCVPAPRSIYRSIRKLMPGTCVRVNFDGTTVERRFWSLADYRPAMPCQDPEARQLDALEAALTASVSRQLVADVEVGVFLSGGIDSSLVAALASKQHPGIKTFSVGFEVEAYNEAPHARAIAAHLGTDHHELTVSPAALLEIFPRLVHMYDEPFGDASAVPTHLLSRFVRQHVTVALSGDGGDEQFFGYGRYHLLAKLLPWMRRVPGLVRRLARRVPFTGEHGRLEHWAHGLLGYPDLAGLYAHYCWSWYLRLAHLMGAGPWDWVEDNRCLEAGREGFALAEGDVLQGMMLADLLHYLPDDCLVKTDRASMASSLEVRVPLLDEMTLRQSLAMPLDLKWRNGTWKHGLKEILARHVPRQIFDRPKMGFGVPLDHWLFHELRDFTEGLLTPDNCAAAGLDHAQVQRLCRQHQAGQVDHQYFLWPVCCLIAWTLHAAERRRELLAAGEV